jgi:hypothetical protein
MSNAQNVTAANIDINGTWRLLSVEEYIDGKLHNPHFQGRNPNGFIHYLPGNRVAVLIANDGRKQMSGDRYNSPLEERAESSSTFTGYGGPYTREGNKLTHHLEISSYENDVGQDYVRFIELDGEDMYLVSAPMAHQGHERVLKLKWRRVNY